MVDMMTDMILGSAQWAFSSALLLVIFLVLRQCMKRRISRRLQYGLWIIVGLRLLIPTALVTLPGTWTDPAPGTLADEIPILYSWDGEGWAQGAVITAWEDVAQYVAADYAQAQKAVERSLEEKIPAEQTGPAGNTQVVSKGNGPLTAIFHLSEGNWIIYALLIWPVGCAVLGTVILVSNGIFYLRLRKVRRAFSGVKTPWPVYVTRGMGSSFVFGVLRPAIYLTEDVAADETLCANVLEHELCHCRRRDHRWAMVRSLCLILHWYDPLVWIAVSCHRTDMELACDEEVLSRKDMSDRILYGKCLLQLADGPGLPGPLFCVTLPICDKGGSMKERITYITTPPKKTGMAAVFVLLACLLAGACSFTQVGEYVPDVFSMSGTYCMIGDEDIAVDDTDMKEVSIRDEFSLRLWEGFDYYVGSFNGGDGKMRLSIYYHDQLVGSLQPYKYEKDPYYYNKQVEMDALVEETGIILSKEGESVAKGYMDGLWSDGVMTVEHQAEDGTGYSHRYYFFCTDDTYTYVFWMRADFEAFEHLVASVASLQVANSEETVLLRESRGEFYDVVAGLLSKYTLSEYGSIALDEEYGFIYPPGITCESRVSEDGQGQLVLCRDGQVIGGLDRLYYDVSRHPMGAGLSSREFLQEYGIYPYQGDHYGIYTARSYHLEDRDCDEFIRGEIPLMIRVESTEQSPSSYRIDHFLYYVGGEEGLCYDLWLDMSLLTEEEMEWFLTYGLWKGPAA